MRPPGPITVDSPPAREAFREPGAPTPAPAPPAPEKPKRSRRRRPEKAVRPPRPKRERRSRPAAPAPDPGERSWRDLLVALPLAALTIYLCFNAGGFFPDGTAYATIGACGLLALGVLLSRRPFAPFGGALGVPLALLAGFAAWTLVSALWSEASWRSLFEFDRALLFTLAFAFFGLVGAGGRRLEWGLRGFALTAVAIAAVALTTRLAADLWPIADNIHPERLSFPLTYWNSLGLLATLGLLACLHLSSGERQPRGWRVAGAAALPLLGATLLLTFSRGSLAVAVLGLLVYAAVARPRRLLGTVAAAGLPTAVAMFAAYDAEIVSSEDFAGAEGVAQGHDLALVVIACVAAAALLRLLFTRLDEWLDAWSPPVVDRRRALVAGGAAALVLVVAAVALGVPSRIGDEYSSFVEGAAPQSSDETRSRLTSFSNNGRLDQLQVSLEGFEAEPLRGTGAGTYQLQWNQLRDVDHAVIDAHSLYLEVLGELGVVGLLLIGGSLLAIVVGLARRLGGGERHVYAAALTLVVAWAVHAAIDWDWEMPAVTLWLFALAGLGLARPMADATGRLAGFAPAWPLRALAAVCVAALAIVPAAIGVSQNRLETALGQFDRNECDAAIATSRDSLDLLDRRPEPYEVIGYCQARQGREGAAEVAMLEAVERDPENWETHYGLALIRALYGQDPLPALEEARRLNPLEPRVRELIEEMAGGSPLDWQRSAAGASLPF